MPAIGDVWARCSDDRRTDVDDCGFATRFPGFGVHVALNLVWATAALLGVLGTLGAAFAVRAERAARFEDEAAAARYDAARRDLALCAAAASVVAAIPIAEAAL